jgi:hypothetical protein
MAYSQESVFIPVRYFAASKLFSAVREAFISAYIDREVPNVRRSVTLQKPQNATHLSCNVEATKAYECCCS